VRQEKLTPVWGDGRLWYGACYSPLSCFLGAGWPDHASRATPQAFPHTQPGTHHLPSEMRMLLLATVFSPLPRGCPLQFAAAWATGGVAAWFRPSLGVTGQVTRATVQPPGKVSPMPNVRRLVPVPTTNCRIVCVTGSRVGYSTGGLTQKHVIAGVGGGARLLSQDQTHGAAGLAPGARAQTDHQTELRQLPFP